MKLNNSVSGEIVGENIGETRAFGFEVNAKAFRLLSDNIYKDKIGSIVRELSSNAYDAHKAANNESTPFYIHLPTSFERFFSIRDYGIGLCREDVHKVYSTYFKSTKDNSNDMIGAFGLGSKTPFSYTDSFTIKSYFNGKLYIFVAMVDADGVPILSELGAEDTMEHNGLEISFAVENYNDFRSFSTACSEQLRFFDIKPLTNTSFTWQPTFTITKDYGKMKIINANNEIYIKIGQVGYRVSNYEIVNNLSDAHKSFFDIFPNVIIEAGIGNVEVTVSREGLSYSKQTISFLQKFIDEQSKLIFKEINDNWDTAANDFERIKLLEVFDKPNKVFKLLNLSFKNQNIVVVNGQFIININEHDIVNPVIFSNKSATGVQFIYPVNHPMILSSDSIYIVNGKVKYYKWRVSGIFNDYKHVYILNLDEANASKYKDVFDILPLTKAETLPLPADFEERKKAMKPVCWLSNIEHITHTSLHRAHRVFDDFDDDITTEKVYIVRNYNSDYKINYSPSLLSAFRCQGILSEVYCIRPDDEDDVKKLPNFIPLDVFIKNKILEANTDNLNNVIRLSKKKALLDKIGYTINESNLRGLINLSNSDVAKKIRNILSGLDLRIKKVSSEYRVYKDKLTVIEECLLEAAAADYYTANYISTTQKYIEQCFTNHKKELESLNEIKRHTYYNSEIWKYVVELVDEKLDLASVH